jgi:hypothetical protein
MQAQTRHVVIVLVWLLLTPAIAHAQASIAGVVRDMSGAILPGVTVEAASPALIEKVRSVVTDGSGQYRIVDLRPGAYTVTFTLPGFATVKREGIELAGTFTATVNAELRVGTLEETITVTGEPPVVDVQSVQQEQIVSRDLIAALPTGRAFLSLVTLNPSVVVSEQDVGGTRGPASVRYTSHGGLVTDSRILADGLGVASADGGGAAGSWYVPNITASQEVVTTSAGGLGESETAGVIVNVISRDGGNNRSGTFFGTGLSPGMQSDNFTRELQDRGLSARDRISRNWDFTAALGGPIVRDKLWYFAYGRHMVADNYVAGMFHNKNAGNPNAWTYEPDLSRQAIQHGKWWSAALRLTWQASARNKIAVFWDEQYRCAVPGGCPNTTATSSPEAGSLGGRAFNDRVQQATWTSPVTNRLLLEAGFGTHILSWGGEGEDRFLRLTRVQEQAGAIPGLNYRGISGLDRRGNKTLNWRSSLSYVSGAHSAKVGYRGTLYDYRSNPFTLSGGVSFRFNNGVPNQLTQTVENFTWRALLYSHGVYAQDQWTVRRLTLQGAVRYDHWRGTFPASQLGPTRFVPVPVVFPETKGARFHDVTPRMSAAYDLFGDGRTGLKVHLGRYIIAQESSSEGTFGSFMHPIRRLATSTSRSWNDANRNYVPDCDLANRAANGECGAMDNRRFATDVFSVTYDPDVVSGWGVRPYSWEFGASVQREVVPRVSATVGYFRRWYGNFAVTDNLATTAADYTLFNLPVPVDPRLPNSGGVVTGVATINPDKFGQVSNQVTAARNFGKQIERWNGVDLTLNARLPDGAVVQGGLSTGHWLKDNCEVAAKLPEVLGTLPLEFCRQEQPFQTQAKFLGAYTIPRVDVQVSATWQNIPGPTVQANYTVPNAVIAPILGRNLAGNAANQTVSLVRFVSQAGGNTPIIGPVDLAGERLNQVDFRVAKLLTFGRTRTLVGLDLFNALNSSVVTSQNNTFGPRWLTPAGILQARLVKVSVQLDF